MIINIDGFNEVTIAKSNNENAVDINCIAKSQGSKLNIYGGLNGFDFKRTYSALHSDKKYKHQFSILKDQKNSNIAWVGIPFILNSKDKKYKLNVMNKLNNKGVMTRPIISGNFANQPSIKLYKIKTGRKLHNADLIDKNAFFLGLGS